MLYSRLKMGRKAIIMMENVILPKNPLYIHIYFFGVTEKRESACVVPKAEMLFIKSFPY